jgi:hypothetical protein
MATSFSAERPLAPETVLQPFPLNIKNREKIVNNKTYAKTIDRTQQGNQWRAIPNGDTISGLWAVAMIPLLAGNGISAISGESLRRLKFKQGSKRNAL